MDFFFVLFFSSEIVIYFSPNSYGLEEYLLWRFTIMMWWSKRFTSNFKTLNEKNRIDLYTLMDFYLVNKKCEAFLKISILPRTSYYQYLWWCFCRWPSTACKDNKLFYLYRHFHHKESQTYFLQYLGKLLSSHLFAKRTYT